MNNEYQSEIHEKNLSFEKYEIEELYERHLKNHQILLDDECICQNHPIFKNQLSYLHQKALCISSQYYSELYYSSNPKIFTDDIKSIKNLICLGSLAGYDQFEQGGNVFYTEEEKILEPKTFYCYLCDNCVKTSRIKSEIIQTLRRPIENLLREIENLPKIGEGWTSEVTLRNYINEVLSSHNLECKFHYRPPFLEGLELDLYFEYKGFKIGIEYQGQQHFKPIDFFGGKKAYNKLVERDKKKQELCKSHNIKLIYFNFDEPLNKDFIISKLEKQLSISFT